MAILLIAGAGFNWFSHARLERRIAKIHAAGDPVSIADLAPPAIAPEDNAAQYLSSIADDCVKLYDALYRHVQADDFSWQTGLNADQIAKTEQAFVDYPNVLPAFAKALGCTQSAWELDYSLNFPDFLEELIVHIGPQRSVSRVQDCRARYLAAIGQPNESVNMYLQMLQLARLQENEPTLVCAFANLATRGAAIEGLNGLLQTKVLSPSSHQAIEKELAQHDALAAFVDTLKSERALGIMGFRVLPTPLGLFNGQWANYLDNMEQQILMGAKSQYELVGVKTAPAKGLWEPVESAIVASRETLNRVRASMRCLRILNAILARTENTEKIEIDALLQLAGLPPETGIDPYTGQSLIIKKTQAGWLVYSVGNDGVDGGGEILDNARDIGVGPQAVETQ